MSTVPPVPPSDPATAFMAQMEQRRRRQNIILTAAVAITAVLATLFGLSAAGALKFGREPNNVNRLQAKGTPAPAPLQKAGSAVAAPLAKTEEGAPEMPDDVYRWLKHLEECERRKVEITGDQQAEMLVFMQKSSALGAGMGLMNPYDQSSDSDQDKEPGSYAQGKILDLRPQWDDLIIFFNSVPPPEECRPLANDFSMAINEIPGMMGDVGSILNDVASNPEQALSQAKKLQNTSYSNIDRSFARADQKLGQICEKYGKSKWFNIKTDVGGAGLLGKNMLGG